MPPTTRSVTIRIDEDLHLALRVEIARLDTSFQAVILACLRDWLKNQLDPKKRH